MPQPVSAPHLFRTAQTKTEEYTHSQRVRAVLSYCVPFDSELDNSDERHFYMEREWRVRGDVRFTLTDVERVVLPRECASSFRSELPVYEGQLSFPV
jgi:hypothetical protein